MTLEDKHNVTHGVLKELSNSLFPAQQKLTFVTSQILAVNSTMFPLQNIHKHTQTSPDGRLTTRLFTY